MGTEGTLLCSGDLTTGLCSQIHEFQSMVSRSVSSMSILILSSSLNLADPSGLFLSRVPTESLHVLFSLTSVQHDLPFLLYWILLF
jgi:hypothetical protein